MSRNQKLRIWMPYIALGILLCSLAPELQPMYQYYKEHGWRGIVAGPSAPPDLAPNAGIRPDCIPRNAKVTNVISGNNKHLSIGHVRRGDDGSCQLEITVHSRHAQVAVIGAGPNKAPTLLGYGDIGVQQNPIYIDTPTQRMDAGIGAPTRARHATRCTATKKSSKYVIPDHYLPK